MEANGRGWWIRRPANCKAIPLMILICPKGFMPLQASAYLEKRGKSIIGTS